MGVEEEGDAWWRRGGDGVGRGGGMHIRSREEIHLISWGSFFGSLPFFLLTTFYH